MTDINRTYKSAYGVYLNSAITQIVTPDITTMALRNVSRYFQQLSIVIYDHYYKKDQSIDLFRYLNELDNSDLTIQAWLDTKTTEVLAVSDVVPLGELISATYSDITYRNFKLLPGDVNRSQGDQDLLSTSKAPDIRVVKMGIAALDYVKLKQKTLWSVNGHLVRAVADDKALYLLGAGKHFQVNDNIHVGCINFNLLSNVDTVPITEADLHIDVTGQTPKLHIRTPQSVYGKKVWLSLAGRLLFDGIIKQTGDNVITVDLTRYDLVNRIFRSQDFIDLTHIVDPERTVIPKDYYLDEKVLTALFTHFSTFLIILDNPYVNVTREKLIRYNHPFTYTTSERRKLPLLLGNGLLAKYFTRKYRHNALLDVDIGTYTKYLNDTTGTGYANVFHKQVSSADPADMANGYLLNIQARVVQP